MQTESATTETPHFIVPLTVHVDPCADFRQKLIQNIAASCGIPADCINVGQPIGPIQPGQLE